MAEENKTPIAIRVTRPFGSDEEFLEQEIETLTRTTVTLLGAQSRPQGVILRFEVTLTTGAPLLRGEGRVVAFRQASQGVDAGLTLRFTRLDARSKALVDRAASIREARARAASSHPPRGEPVRTPAPPEPPPRPAAPDPPPSLPPPPPLVQARPRSLPPPLPARALAGATVSAPAPPAPAPAHVPPPAPSSGRALPSIRAPAARRREELLDRLRQRAKTLTRADVESLLASKRKRPTIDSP